jgi:hypothetical protein
MELNIPIPKIAHIAKWPLKNIPKESKMIGKRANMVRVLAGKDLPKTNAKKFNTKNPK